MKVKMSWKLYMVEVYLLAAIILAMSLVESQGEVGMFLMEVKSPSFSSMNHSRGEVASLCHLDSMNSASFSVKLLQQMRLRSSTLSLFWWSRPTMERYLFHFPGWQRPSGLLKVLCWFVPPLFPLSRWSQNRRTCLVLDQRGRKFS